MRGSLLGCLLLAAACRAPAEPEAQPEGAPPDLSGLLVAGCRDLVATTTCVVEGATRVTLWAPVKSTTRLELKAHGALQPTEWKRVDGGFQGALTVTSTTGSVEVLARRGQGPAGRRMIRIQGWTRPEALSEALKLARKDPEKARAALDVLQKAKDVRTRAEAMLLRAKLEFVTGNFEEANEIRLRLAALADQKGWPDTAARAREPVIFTAVHLQPDFGLARKVLESAARAPRSPYADLTRAYNEGLYQRAVGDPRAAVRHLSRAEALARRLDETPLLYMSTQLRANLLSDTGLHKEALKVFRSPGEPQDPGCSLAWWSANDAWLRLMAVESGAMPESGSANDVARQALASSVEDCDQPQMTTNMLGVLALAQAQVGDWDSAKDSTAQAWKRRDSMPGNAPPWLWEVQGRAALATGNLEAARKAYSALGEFARRAGRVRWQWRAVVGQAQVLARTGRTRHALRKFEKAEKLLDRWAPSTLLPSGATVWGEALDRAAESHAELLFASGQPEKVVEVLVRRSRRRLSRFATASRIQLLDEGTRAHWEKAAQRYASLRARLDALMEKAWSEANWRESEAVKELGQELEAALDETISALGPQAPIRTLEAPPDGELFLGFESMGNCVLGFAWSRTGREVRKLDCTDDRITEPSGWLVPFAEAIRKARRITIHAQSRVRSVDFHAVLFDAQPLGSARVVVYSVAAPIPEDLDPEGDFALVVADPTGDLPKARDEGAWVATRLRSSGLSVDERQGRKAHRGLLGRPFTWLHWAGHGIARERSLDSLGTGALPLADGASIEPSDLLTLSPAPRNVVLTACQTSPTGTRHLTLAEAFLLAGSRIVVATTRPVEDEAASRFARAFYAGAFSRGPDMAIRKAYEQLVESNDDWAAFRVFVP